MTELPAYAGLFLTALLAATLLPGSSEVVLAAMLAAGDFDALPLVAVATGGNTAGALVNWALGRFLLRFRDRRWFPLTPAMHERAHRWFVHYGAWSLLFSWLPVVGDPLTVVAGVLRVDVWRFVTLVGLGKAARYAAVALTVRWVEGG